MKKILAVVGRPNVGKSTLFNRLTESMDAIVDKQSGVTRDRHYGKVLWNGKTFSVIDTGGYVLNSGDVFEKEICKQVTFAIEEAGTILFIVDARDGITEMDKEIASMLRRSNKKVIVGANKVDSPNMEHEAAAFYALGFDNIFPISSINGGGTGDLLDAVTADMETDEQEEEEDTEIPRFSVVGRPNVGKSSFINVLIENERNIVTPIAGTTRDSLLTQYNKFGLNFFLVDTAGIRKKSKVHEDLEFYSVLRSIRAIENSNVCFLMLDATAGIESQDLSIFDLIVKNNKGVVVLVNKWDLVEKDTLTSVEYEKVIRERLSPFSDVPIIFISALNKQRIFKALETGIEVFNNRSLRIKTSVLNEMLLPLIEAYPPPAYKGKYIKIKYISQLPLAYPAFAFFCNLPQYLKEPYKRFLENKLREKFNFSGVPMQIFFRKK